MRRGGAFFRQHHQRATQHSCLAPPQCVSKAKLHMQNILIGFLIA